MTDLLTSPAGLRAKAHLPPLYETARSVDALFQAAGTELDAVRATIEGVLDQFFLRTAGFGLGRIEADLALAAVPGLTDDQRRDRAVGRVRGYGTATIVLVRNVAEAYARGRVDVEEDHAAYAVTVRFVDEIGVPTNLGDLRAAVEAVVPAHLTVLFRYRYVTWEMVKNQALTWGALGALGLTWAELKVHEPFFPP